ncbi:MAG: YciI family protein [Phenylobacterium sp.]
MPLFNLVCIDKPDSLDLRMATREAHLAYARERLDQIKLGGPFLSEAGEMAGSMLILEAPDLATAWAFNHGDPYTLAGLFERVEVRPIRITLGQL